MTSVRHFILGTAGHVDHGKTELVRALTGHDTDRLKEEKARGISIELGFAPLPLADDTFIGIVDVPGHERFVRQMVAGAGGFDMAMLLVAADEGVMPQTREHMEVLASLHIPHGVIVISKCDLATPETMELLRDELAELTDGTFLDSASIVETSARTGSGIDVLKKTLLELTRKVEARDFAGPFRLAVDRVFHQKGIGVVVTGSAYSGAVSVGDTLQLLPSQISVRVRDLQSFGGKRDRGEAGERLALALQGVRLEDARRGDMLCEPERFRPVDVFDARVRVSSGLEIQLKNRERIRVHHGAREVLGRIILLEHEAMAPGESGLAQLRLESPLVVAPGDHVVIRRYSPARVFGGGTIVDTSTEKHRRFDDAVLGRLRTREQGDPVRIFSAVLDRAGAPGVAQTDADPESVRVLVEEGKAVVAGDRVYATTALEQLGLRIEQLATEHVQRYPLQWGVDKEELRQRAGFPHGPAAFNRVLEILSATRALFVRENRVRAGSETARLPETVAREVEGLADAIRLAGTAFPSRSELESGWRSTHRFLDALAWLRDRGDVVEVGEGAIHRDALRAVTGILQRLFANASEVGVGEVKDALGLSRKHVIPLLEHFDGRRVTIRAGNVRRRGPAFPDE